MTNKKNTRRALFMSAMSLILCFAMLMGTTFAWFTDSVTSANNIIKSGNLDVELYYQVEKQTDWTPVDATTNIFKEGALWEPGHTEVVKLKVVNAGSLALKYQLGVNVASEKGSVNVNGNAFNLSDFIKFGIVDGNQPYTREEAVAAVADKETSLNVAYHSEVTKLEPNNPAIPGANEKIVTMVVYMPTSVGNDANHAKSATPPTINLGVNLYATQVEHEYDSFNNMYDNMATYLNQDAEGNWLVSDSSELRYFAYTVNNGTNYKGETVKLTADIDLNGYNWLPIKGFAGTFEGNSKTISNLTVKGTSNVAFFSGISSTAKIQNVTFDKATVSGEHYVAVVLGWESNESANALIQNVKVTNSTVTGAVANNDNGDKIGGIVGYAVSLNIENCAVENSTITGYRDVGGIIGYAHKKAVVKNNSVNGVRVVCDPTVNYKNYTKADEYDIDAIVGEAVSTAVVEGNTYTDVNIVVPEDVASVGTAADLQKMLTELTSSGAGDTVLNITSDIDIGEATWESVTVQGYTGADVITVNGNGHTITGLNAPLFTGGFAGGSGIIIKDLTIEKANFDVSAKYEATGVGTFICAVDSMDVITLDNCHLIDSKIIGSRTGGLVGWTSGYANQNDGPVDTYVTIRNCSVFNCEITGYGTVGAINGHAGASSATFTRIENCTIKDNTLTSYDDSYRVGIVLGTANVGEVTINNITESGNTVKQINGSTEIARPAGQSPLYGRAVFGNTGSMTIDGVAVAK